MTAESASTMALQAEPPDPLQWLLGDLDPDSVWLPGALILGTFGSEDLTCIAAGLLAAAERMPFVVATAACALGIFLGDLALYAIGRAGSSGLLRWDWVRRGLPADGGSRWRELLDRRGGRILLASRFLPGTRLPTYLACGALRWSPGRFAAYLAVGALLWTPIVVSIAMWTGGLAILGSGLRGVLGLVAAVLGAWLLVRLLVALCSWRGRRLLVGRLRRWTRFEYWPRSVVYAPVVVALTWRWMTKERFFTGDPCLFTACNPGIPHGGIVGESKTDILDKLRGDAVAPYVRLDCSAPLETRLAQVERMLDLHGRAVLKPDRGERGEGVAVVRSVDEARSWLAACPRDAILQEYVGGAEFGVVWRRRFDGTSSEIRSIARKVPPAVVGDGEHTLEWLILADARQVAMARWHLGRLTRADLERVPATGVRVSLGELGTHCRGATFEDARDLATPELLAALDAIMADAPDLDFGRFDLRVPTERAFCGGDDLCVLEFNGVTGEPAHVYQPDYPWWRGMADLVGHWWTASANGRARRAAGHRPTSGFRLLRLALRSRKESRFEIDGVLRPAPRHESMTAPAAPSETSTSIPSSF